MASISNVGMEDFERFNVGAASPFTLSFTNALGSSIGTAVLTGPDVTIDSLVSESAGRYAVSGTNYMQVYRAQFGPNIKFNMPQYAFGFYAIDAGDSGFQGDNTGGQIQLTFDGTRILTVPNGTGITYNASILFSGYALDSLHRDR